MHAYVPSEPWRSPANWMSHAELGGGRADFISDWLGRNRLDEGRAAVSRHWFGNDLDKPTVRRFGRRETDVRECLPGATRHAPDAGQLAEAHAPRGAHRHIHGDANQQRLPADRVIYERGHSDAPARPRHEGSVVHDDDNAHCFFLGGGRKDTKASSNSEWRRGDKREFLLGDEGAPIPPMGPQADSGWALGPRGGKPIARPQPIAEVPESGFVGLGSNQAPAAGQQPRGLKLSDIHEGAQYCGHHTDPPSPAANAFRRSASDVTALQSKSRAVLNALRCAGSGAAAAAPGSTSNACLMDREPRHASAAGMTSERVGRGLLRYAAIADYELAVNENRDQEQNGSAEYDHRHTPTDIHLHSYEDTKFRQEDAIRRVEQESGQRPRYGRRKSAVLAPADYDLIPAY